AYGVHVPLARVLTLLHPRRACRRRLRIGLERFDGMRNHEVGTRTNRIAAQAIRLAKHRRRGMEPARKRDERVALRNLVARPLDALALAEPREIGAERVGAR